MKNSIIREQSEGCDFDINIAADNLGKPAGHGISPSLANNAHHKINRN